MKKYNGEKAVISLTSWRARIDTVHKTIENLLTMCPGFHVCLTLSLEEFPNGVFSLPRSLTDLEKANKIEILWVKKNVKAFKKVLFAMLHYPDVPVISADDDTIYSENYAEKLYQSWVNCEKVHQIHGYEVDKGSWPCQFPCGQATLYPPCCFGGWGLNLLTDEIIATGQDDIYYGVLAFRLGIPFVEVSKRRMFSFHDTAGAIGATPQQLVNAREVCFREVDRQLKAIQDSEKLKQQAEIQMRSMFKDKTSVIVALTSHTRERLADLPKFLWDSVLKYNFTFAKVVLTLHESDVEYMPSVLKGWIENGLVELIVSKEDLGPHLKYFYTMQKYRDLPVITIDDDTVYPRYMIPLYLYYHQKHPGWVLCRSCRQITYTNGNVDPFSVWQNVPTIDGPTHQLHAEGYCGVLYPPDCLKIRDDMIPEIKSIFRADDIYLSVLEIRNNVPVFFLRPYGHQLDVSTKGEHALSTMEDCMPVSDKYVKMFEKEFNKECLQ